MKQLKLTNQELKSIGFKKCQSEADEMNFSSFYFKVKTINGYFYYNPTQEVYTWYHKTIIGDTANDVHLDVTKKAELFVLLQCFKAEFKLVF
jgi:ssDNA-specific exonuclease RecJ